MNRPDWNEYFMHIAQVVATRGTCDRKQVGAVLVRNNAIIATGYNGSLPGLLHCSEAGHDLDEGNHCVRTVHAEANALCFAARAGHSVEGAFLYTTSFPCWQCFRLAMSAGVRHFCYAEAYRMDPRVLDVFKHPRGTSSTVFLTQMKLKGVEQ